MIQITTRIIVRGKSPSQIYNWLICLTPQKYRQWHPAHIDWRRSSDVLKIGDTIGFEEILNGYKINYDFKIIEVKIDESISILMKAKCLYPLYLHLSLRPLNKDTEVTHEIRVGFSFIELDKIFDWLVRQLYFTQKRIEAIKKHAIEEFRNLEKII